MSTEKQIRLPSTDEVNALGSAVHGVEQLAGTILLDRYRLVRLLGTGGAAVVYRAEHTIMQKTVAVKILRPELAQRQDFIQRFLVEARTVARLRHENIVDIVDVGRTETGLAFCVMEYLDGEELGVTLARETRLPWPRARDIVLQVCQALAAAHAAGVVHRDVKPQNCFRIRHGNNHDFIKLLDFGIAKLTDSDQGLTETGMIMGTAEYMSPEQARGRNVDARTDIYAVGAMLFELLAGRAPFEGETFLDILMKHASDPVPRISTIVEGIDPQVEAIINRALAKKPEDRYQSITHMIAALAAIDRDTFRGLLDSHALRRIDSRPDSVLQRRPSSSHGSLPPASRVRQRAVIAISAIGVLGALGLWRILAADGDTDSAATTSVAAVPAVPLEEGVKGPDRPAVTHPPDPEERPAVPPATQPEPPPPLVEAAPTTPPVVQQSTPTPPEASPPSSPSIPGRTEKPPRGARSPSTTKKPSARAVEKQLSKRILNACAKDIKGEQSVKLSVTTTEIKVTECRYKPLRKCITDKVGVSGLQPGDYSVPLKPKAVTTDPFEDDG